MRPAELWRRILDDRRPPILIAEIGGNHGGRVGLAKRMIRAAKSAGADLVKFQLYRPEEFFSPSYIAYADFAREALDPPKVLELVRYARRVGIGFFATPFDSDNLNLLVRVGAPCLKVASGDLTFIPFLRAVGSQKKCVMISAGGGTNAEISKALRALRSGGCRHVVLMHCVSSYPADPADQHLRVLPELAKMFRVPVGFSDHTPGIEASLAACALGARVIEKHFTIDRLLPGGDNAMSILPSECRALTDGLRRTTELLGRPVKCVAPAERKILRSMRRGIYARRNIRAGAKLKSSDLVCLRPESGFPAALWYRVIGSRLSRPVPALTALRPSDLHR